MIVKTLGYRNEKLAEFEFPKAKDALAFVSDLSDRGFLVEGGFVKTVVLFEIGNEDGVMQ